MRESVFNRREMMGRAVVATTALSGASVFGGGAVFNRQVEVALQLYSTRVENKKDKGRNVANVIPELAKMGYTAVEIAGTYGWSVKDFKSLLDDNGIKIISSHTRLNLLQGDKLKQTVEEHHLMGATYVCVPMLSRSYSKDVDSWKKAADVFSAISEELKAEGMRIGYHNHSVEFKVLENGQTGWEVFFGHTSPDVIMQLDTGNCMNGKGDPVAMLKKFPGRATLIHAKEHPLQPNQKALIGEGDVPWKEVVELARTVAGTEYLIVEQGQSTQPPLEAVKICLDNLKKLMAG